MSGSHKASSPSLYTITALLLKLVVRSVEKPWTTALDYAESFAHTWSFAAKFPSFLYSKIGNSSLFISQCLTPKSFLEYHKMVDNLQPAEKFSAKESSVWSFLKHLSKALGSNHTPVWYLKNLPDITELGNDQILYGHQKDLRNTAAANVGIKNHLDNELIITVTKNSEKLGDYLIGPDRLYKTEEDFVRSALHEEINATWKDSSQKIKYDTSQLSIGFFETLAYISYAGSEIFEYTTLFPTYVEKGWHAYKEALCSYTESEKMQSVRTREAQKIVPSSDQNVYVTDVLSDQKLSSDPTWFTH